MPTCPSSISSPSPLSLWSIKSWAYIIVAISILLAISLQSILVYLLWIFYGDHLYLLGYIFLSSIGFLSVVYAVMSLLNYFLDSPSRKHVHIYEHDKYPHRPSVIDPNMYEYSHDERIKQDREGGGMARGVPFDFNLIKNSKIYKFLTNNHFRDLEQPVIRGIESGLSFLDGYIKRNTVIKFQDLLEDKQEKKRKSLENQDEGEEEEEEEEEENKVLSRRTITHRKRKSTQFLKCSPCKNSKKCHYKTHVTLGNHLYHCHTYQDIVNLPQPRKKMSKVVIYGHGQNDDDECNKIIRDFFKAREKPKNWSAPNDYPNRNLHEMIQRKFPQIPDGGVEISHTVTNGNRTFNTGDLFASNNENENSSNISSKNQKDYDGSAKKRYCTLKKPCIFCQENPLVLTSDSGDESNWTTVCSACDYREKLRDCCGNRRLETNQTRSEFYNRHKTSPNIKHNTTTYPDVPPYTIDESSKHKQILPKVLLLYHNLTYDDY